MVLILIFNLPILSYGQVKTITGTVVTSEDNSPLPGASVVIKGTTTGTQTDFDGNYSIEANVGDILVFSYVGYGTQEITVATEAVINVSLKEDTSMLDEIVITGYGKQTRATLPVLVVTRITPLADLAP